MTTQTAGFSLRRTMINFLSGVPGRRAELDTVSLHGEYIGISPGAAAQGASFEEATVGFSFDRNGIMLFSPVVVGANRYDFRVQYSPEWVFHLKGWDVDECLALRQGKTSALAEAIISFSPRFSLVRHDALMMLGEGMPAILGVFVRKGKSTKWLKKLYEQSYEPAQPSDEVHQYLGKMRTFLPSDDVPTKVEALKSLGNNLWTGTPQDVAERLPFIELGLQDKHPRVQAEALSVFELGGRVTGGVKPVADMLARHKTLSTGVVVQALSAASCLLYEAYRFNHKRAELVRWFGSSDIAAVHRSSGGLVAPDEIHVIEDVARELPEHRVWTREHMATLREAMTLVLAQDSFLPERSQQDAARALKEYAL